MRPITRQSHRRSLRAGFTLLEIMLVVTIIALLLAGGIYAMKGNLGFAEQVRIDGDIKSVSSQLRLYYAQNGFFPSTEQGLEALVKQPQSDPRPKRWQQLMDKVPTDPWQMPYQYRSPGQNGADFDLWSFGKDRKEGGGDDMGLETASK